MFYKINDNAINLIPAIYDTIPKSESDIRGFFRKRDIETMLAKTDCVGLRFYNINKTATESFKLIAAAAKADGTEHTDHYIVSLDINASDLSQPAAAITSDRNSARNKTPNSLFDQTMSFFSATRLNAGLSIGADGLVFYQTNISKVGNSILIANGQGHLIDPNIDFKTHVAVPVFLTNGRISSREDAANFLSIHPCPGHCLGGNNAIVSHPPVGTNLATDPYLFDWRPN
ncbi:MAG: hypothetical protein AAGA77_20905 [Bacteroidota bacterium]